MSDTSRIIIILKLYFHKNSLWQMLGLLRMVSGGLLSKASGLMGGLLGKASPFLRKLPFIGNMLGKLLHSEKIIPDLMGRATDYAQEKVMEYG